MLFAGLSGLIAFITLLGYINNVERFYSLRPFGSIALPAAAGLLILSIELVRRQTQLIASPQLSLGALLCGLVIGVLLPAFVFMVSQTRQALDADHAAIEQRGREYARDLAEAVQGQIAAKEALLTGLATAPSLKSGDLASFYEQTKSALNPDEGNIVLFDAAGRLLLVSGRPLGEPLPAPASPESAKLAFETGRAQLSDLYVGAVNHRFGVAISIPVTGTGFVLRTNLWSTHLSSNLRQSAPEGWILTVIDRNGIILARTKDAEQWIGKPASSAIWSTARTAETGWTRAETVEGMQAYSAWWRLPSGWTALASVPESKLDLASREHAIRVALGGALTIVLGLFFAALTAISIGQPLRRLSFAGEALGRGETVPPIRSSVREIDALGNAISSAAAQRKQAEEHLRFVMRELSHRTKNVLAVTHAIARQTSRTSIDLEHFEKRFGERLSALACSHDLLAQGNWHGVSLKELVHAQLAPFLDKPEVQLLASGPALLLTTEVAQTLGLALHELATNASKYGALSRPTGRIEISWWIDPNPLVQRRFHMGWREVGGPTVNPPKRNGFGHVVIKDMISRGLDSEVVLDFAPQGFIWRVTASTSRMLAGGPADKHDG